jgi:formylglycine-generating enzyme required for sulfatase activity
MTSPGRFRRLCPAGCWFFFGCAFAARLFAAEVVTIKDLDLALVPIPAGTFTMGRPEGFPGSSRDERPVTRVTFAKPFWLGATEVTVGQFKQFVAATGYVTAAEKNGRMWNWVGPGSVYEQPAGANWRKPGRLTQDDRHPVVGVNWDDAIAFCRWLTERERAAGRLRPGHVYTLPTEAQWEYACRVGRDEPENQRAQHAPGGPEKAERLGPPRHGRQRVGMVSRLVCTVSGRRSHRLPRAIAQPSRAAIPGDPQ